MQIEVIFTFGAEIFFWFDLIIVIAWDENIVLETLDLDFTTICNPDSLQLIFPPSRFDM